MYGMVASIAWHLSQHTGGEPFWLPRERLATLLRVSMMTITRVIQLLESHGVLKCVNENWSYSERRAKEYQFASAA